MHDAQATMDDAQAKLRSEVRAAYEALFEFGEKLRLAGLSNQADWDDYTALERVANKKGRAYSGVAPLD